jgi:hypothetical protein
MMDSKSIAYINLDLRDCVTYFHHLSGPKRASSLRRQVFANKNGRIKANFLEDQLFDNTIGHLRHTPLLFSGHMKSFQWSPSQNNISSFWSQRHTCTATCIHGSRGVRVGYHPPPPGPKIF